MDAVDILDERTPTEDDVPEFVTETPEREMGGVVEYRCGYNR